MKPLLTLLLFFTSNSFADVHIDITGLQAGVGQVVVSIWDSEENYLETPYRTKTQHVNQLNDGKLRVTFHPPLPEECAINVYYDVNDNGELDTNWIGIPNEAVGITNNAKGHFGPPEYEDSKVIITGKEQVFSIHVKKL